RDPARSGKEGARVVDRVDEVHPSQGVRQLGNGCQVVDEYPRDTRGQFAIPDRVKRGERRQQLIETGRQYPLASSTNRVLQSCLAPEDLSARIRQVVAVPIILAFDTHHLECRGQLVDLR